MMRVLKVSLDRKQDKAESKNEVKKTKDKENWKRKEEMDIQHSLFHAYQD